MVNAYFHCVQLWGQNRFYMVPIVRLLGISLIIVRIFYCYKCILIFIKDFLLYFLPNHLVLRQFFLNIIHYY